MWCDHVVPTPVLQDAVEMGNTDLTAHLLHNNTNAPKMPQIAGRNLGHRPGSSHDETPEVDNKGGSLPKPPKPGSNNGGGDGSDPKDPKESAKRRKNLIINSCRSCVEKNQDVYCMEKLIGTIHELDVTCNLRTNEMPEEPMPAAQWLLQKLTADLQSAKMWPVKLQGVKHQEALSIMVAKLRKVFCFFNCIFNNTSELWDIWYLHLSQKMIKWQLRQVHDSACRWTGGKLLPNFWFRGTGQCLRAPAQDKQVAQKTDLTSGPILSSQFLLLWSLMFISFNASWDPFQNVMLFTHTLSFIDGSFCTHAGPYHCWSDSTWRCQRACVAAYEHVQRGQCNSDQSHQEAYGQRKRWCFQRGVETTIFFFSRMVKVACFPKRQPYSIALQS